MGQLISDSVEQGREAYRQHAWREAFESLRIADSEAALSPEDLALLAESAWFAGDPDAAIQARERGTRGLSSAGRPVPCRRAALQLAVDHFERLETAIGNGWLGRAKGYSTSPGECAAHGWQAVSLAYIALRVTGDRPEALQQAKLAQDIGGRLGDRALQAALQVQGYALVAMGRIDDGMALIDESTVAAVSGDLDPMTTGKIYCSTISVCRDLSDWRRAVEWTDAAEMMVRPPEDLRLSWNLPRAPCRNHALPGLLGRRGTGSPTCVRGGRYDLGLAARPATRSVRSGRVVIFRSALDAFRQAHQLGRGRSPACRCSGWPKETPQARTRRSRGP